MPSSGQTIIAGYRIAMRESIKYIQDVDGEGVLPRVSWVLGRRESGAPQLEGGHAGAGSCSSASSLWKVWKHRRQHPQDTLMNIAKTSLSSKFIGSESARGLRPAAL